ncbi:heparan-alpha-glucosaminide N-acetyltransferase domain-containing protein [Actinomycetospora callitridis]|uniref:heparan-alpha-glucosaminide N-acetyltransferase domain-containing protein n=1 Tax=Actinomycetospora callitridis TaxID=913944 RepID=UPI0023673542|nr:heparan-alpha-glucosaminide N-acetyltransferase domain-containing protein [Actinomycetospora callitridis]MDD7916715.1 heparan-alpha-glucosaminide N-acetyltransferase domain-containing protein [Actinomycetospora callitridis]
MARTAALPRVEGLAPSTATRGATRAAAPGTVHLRRPVADPRTARGDRGATFLPEQRLPAEGPPDAPTVRLPVARDAGASGSRVRGIDAARGLALLGMIAVHTLPLSENGELTTVGLLAGGTSAALFGLLVGVSVALLTGRRQVTVGAGTFGTHALRLAVRGLAVGVLGLALGEAALGDVDIILTYYGVLFLLAVPLILLPTRALFALGAALAVVAPITSHLVRTGMPPAELIDPSFTALVTDPAGLLTTLFLTGAYPIWPWLTYLCVGMAVGRCSLATTRTAAVLAASGVALVAAAAAVSHLALVTAGGLGRILADPGLPAEELQTALVEGPNGVTPATSWWWLAVDSAHSSTPLDLARTVGTSLAVLGAMLLLDRALARGGSSSWGRIVDAARSPLAAAGSMTLTFYTLHVVVAGLAGEAAAPWTLYLVQVVVALAVGLLWQRFVGRGPLEAGVSTLTDVVAPSPSGRAAGRPAPTRPWRAGLVAALVLAAIVAGAFAVAGDPTAESSSSSATSEQVDGAELDDAGVDGQESDAPAADQPVPSDEQDASAPQDEGSSGTADEDD